MFWAFFSFLFGAVVGSFLNVVIARVPLEESVVSPRSRCPRCGHEIRAFDNVPMLSYLFLGGRCRDCGDNISVRYPLVEFLTASLFTAIYLKWGLSPATPVFWAFTAAMIAIFWIDFDHMIIPDVISLSFIPVGMSAAIVGVIPGMDWQQSFIGTFLGGAATYFPAVIYERIRGVEGLGGGDVKLLAMIGAFTGPYGVVFVLFLASMTGSVAALGAMAFTRAGSTTPIPFGPFITASALVYVFAGTEIIDRFLRLSHHF
jgi:leader peptidase (prepilin peptidase) / N-methyltransferase